MLADEQSEHESVSTQAESVSCKRSSYSSYCKRSSDSSYCPSSQHGESEGSLTAAETESASSSDKEDESDIDIADAWLLPDSQPFDGTDSSAQRSNACPSYIIQAAGSKVRLTFCCGALVIHMPHGKRDNHIGISRGAAPAAIIWQDTVLAAPRALKAVTYLR